MICPLVLAAVIAAGGWVDWQAITSVFTLLYSRRSVSKVNCGPQSISSSLLCLSSL